MSYYANYDIVADDGTQLNVTSGDAINNQHDFELGFSSKVRFDVRSVISYMVNPSASGVLFELSVSNLKSDGSEEYKSIGPSVTLPAQHGFLRQEVIDKNTFAKVNGTGLGVHKLRIRVTSGAASFSDIVHLYMCE